MGLLPVRLFFSRGLVLPAVCYNLTFGQTPLEGAAKLSLQSAPITGELFPSIDVSVKRLHVLLADAFEAVEGATS